MSSGLGNASAYGAGSAASLSSNVNSCSISNPPPCLEYCMPAPYSALYGQTYFTIGDAYGRAAARDCGCSGNPPAAPAAAAGPMGSYPGFTLPGQTL